MNLKNITDGLASILLACLIGLTVQISKLVHDADVAVLAVPGQIDSARHDVANELRLGRDALASEVHNSRLDINGQLNGARADFNKQADAFRAEIKGLKIHVVPW